MKLYSHLHPKDAKSIIVMANRKWPVYQIAKKPESIRIKLEEISGLQKLSNLARGYGNPEGARGKQFTTAFKFGLTSGI